MFEGIYEWLKDLAYYVILVTALFHMIPGEVWGKYIRFFTGLVMVVLLLSPILQLFQEQDPLQIMERYEQGMEAGAGKSRRTAAYFNPGNFGRFRRYHRSGGN